MRILDLFCGAGLAADGYTQAGFDVVGVDLFPQPDYPYEFHQADAVAWLDVDCLDVDAIHASPPCQAHTRAKHLRNAQGGTSKFDDLLTPTLALLAELDIPWVVENVPGAPGMENAITLCGSMFPGLQVQRHRLFLTNWPLEAPGPCNHNTFPPDPITGKPRPWGVFHVPGDNIPKGGRTARDLTHGKEVMGVPAERAITWNELKEGLPPAYTRWNGERLAAWLTA